MATSSTRPRALVAGFAAALTLNATMEGVLETMQKHSAYEIRKRMLKVV
jgi:hypothetical protein